MQGAGPGYTVVWRTPRPIYAGGSHWGSAGGRSDTAYYPRGIGYGIPYSFLEPTIDPCFYGCPDSSADPNVAAAAEAPSWNDAGGPDPQGAVAPAYTAGPYRAQNAPHPAQAPESYANGYQAPYANGYSAPYANGYPAPYPAQAPAPYSRQNSAQYPAQPGQGGDGTGFAQPTMLMPLVPLVSVSRSPNPPDEEETVTLVFKDGRPPLQVRNYILTRSAIYLTGKHFNEILLSDIDLQATQRVNWDAGVTFRLP